MANLKELYNALKADGAPLPDTYESFEGYMTSGPNGGYDHRKQVYDALKADGAPLPDTYEDFSHALFVPKTKAKAAEQPAKESAPEVPSGEAWKPTPIQKAMMSNAVQSSLDGFKAHSDALTDATRNTMEYYKRGGGVTRQPVKGDLRVNPQTNQIEQPYLTPSGHVTTDKGTAERITREYNDYFDNMTVAGQLRRAGRDLQDLHRKREERTKAIHDQWAEDYKKNDAPLAAVLAHDTYRPSIESDPEYRALTAAIHQAEKRVRTLQHESDRQKGMDVGYWRGFGETVGDIKTWDFGYSNAMDAVTTLDAARPSDTARPRTEAQNAAFQTMMEQRYEAEQAQATYGQNDSFWHRAGVMTGEMLPFMIDFAVMGGAKGGSSMITRNLDAFLLKNLHRAAPKIASKKAAQWATKVVGAMPEDLLYRAPLMTNTVQGMKTYTDIVERKLGDVVVREDGTYDFSNHKSWGSAIWQGEANSIIENYSEMFGTHLEGVLTLKNASKIADVFGAKRISGILTKASNSELAGIAGTMQKQLNQLGVSDYFGEVGEEYYGQLWRTMLNLDDAKGADGRNLLLDGQFHGDIWGGMALSMGLLGAGKYSLSAAAYGSMKHRVNKADNRASAIFTPEVWEGWREKIDGTTNDNIGALAESIVLDQDLTDEQKSAAMAYMETSLNMRGFNLGSIAGQRGGEQSEEEAAANESYMEGYSATAPQEMNDAKRMLDLQRARLAGALSEESVSEFDEDPIGALRKTKDSDLRRIAADYVNAKQVYDGMIQRVRDDVDSRIEQSDALIESHVNRTTGMIQPATLRVDDRKVYIIDGRVAMHEDGSGVDSGNSSESIIIRDAETGNIEFADPAHFHSVEEEIDAEDEKAAARERIIAEIAHTAANNIDGVVSVTPGESYDIIDTEGNKGEVTVLGNSVDADGGVIEGTVDVQVADGSIQQMPVADLEQMIDAANQCRVEQFAEEREAERTARDEAERAETESGLNNPNRNTNLLPDNWKMPYYGFQTRAARYIESENGTGGMLYRDDNGNDAIVVAATDDNNYAGYFREYDEHGNPTNRWSAKFQNGSGEKNAYRDMMLTAQELLPAGHELTEHTSISTDGLRNLANQLKHGYELQRNERGEIITNEVALNMMARNNDLGIRDYDAGSIEMARVAAEDYKEVSKKLIPYLEALGLSKFNIHFEDGTIYVDHPVLKRADTDQSSTTEDDGFIPIDPELANQSLEDLNRDSVNTTGRGEFNTGNGESLTETAPNIAGSVENAQESALARIAKDEQGTPLFESADPETAWDALVEDSDDEAEAEEYAAGMTKVLEKEAAQAKKKAANVKVTGDRAKYKAEKEAARGKLEEAEKRLAHWQAMLEIKNRRQQAAEAAAEAEQQRAAAVQAEQARLERERRDAEARAEAERIRREKEDREGIPEMSHDTPEDARQRGRRRLGNTIYTRQEPITEKIEGKEVTVDFNEKKEGHRPKGRLVVMEAAQGQASHMEGKRNPLFFIDEAQPKDRTDAESILAEQKHAREMDPLLITDSRDMVDPFRGAPTVNSRGETIQGNHRMATLRYMYAREPESQKRYREYLYEHAEKFGFTPEQANSIAKMEEPILVNMVDVDDAMAIELGQDTGNSRETGGKDRIDADRLAVGIGDKMGRFMDTLLTDDSEDGDSLRSLIRRNGLDSLRYLRDMGKIDDRQFATAISKDGSLSDEGLEDIEKFIKRTFFAGESREFEEMFDTLPAKAQSAILAQIWRDTRTPEADKATPHVKEAVRAFYAMQGIPQFKEARNFKDALQATEMWRSQTEFNEDGDIVSNRDRHSNFALRFAAMMKGASMKETRSILKQMLDWMQDSGEQGGLFDMMESDEETEAPKDRTFAGAVKKVLGMEYKPGEASPVMAKSGTKNGEGALTNKTNNDKTDKRHEHGENGSSDVAGSDQEGASGEQGSRRNDRGRERAEGEERQAERGGGNVSDDTERRRTGDIQDTERRQQGAVSTAEYVTAQSYVLNSQGSEEFGFIDADKASAIGTLKKAPIKLQVGNDGFGLKHMEKHLAQLKDNGYATIEDFVEDVCAHFSEIRQGNLYTDPTTGEAKETYLLVKALSERKGGKGGVLYIEFVPEGDEYIINSGGVFKNSYISKRKELWNASTEHSATSGESQDFPSAQNKPESDDVSALSESSDSKVNNSASDKQAEGEKSSEKELMAEDLDRIEPDSSGIDESIIDGARDYIEGERTPWSEMCYKTVKEYVRNTRDNRSASSADGDGTQLATSDAEPAGRGEGQEGSGSVGMDREDGGGDVSGSGEMRENSPRSGGSLSGEESAGGLQGETADANVDNTDTGKRAGGRRTGGSGSNVRKPGGKKGSKRNTRTDGAGTAEAIARAPQPPKGGETAQGMIDDALATLQDIFRNPGMSRPGQLNDVTTLLAGLGVNAARFLGATAKLGCGLVMKGYYKYARWQGEMHRNLDPLLAEYTDLTDEQAAEFILSAWDMKMSYRGERKKISEWAAELEQEELRRLAQMGIAEKRKLQAEAEGTEVKVCDLDNIRETLPFLLPAQHEDVEKAERQFFKPEHSDREHAYGKGYLFTNGTGTGKTYTGLGIAKRFIKQGKGRILIVTVNDTKISDWIKDAKNLGIEASQLSDTKSKGKGVVVTQYANLRQNYALLEDEFDLIIYDESHKLMENQEGISGSTADMHHLVAARDAEAVIKRGLETSELGKNLREAREGIKRLNEILNIINKPASLVTAKERDLVRESGYKSVEQVEDALRTAGNLEERLNKEMEDALESAMADETQRAEAERVSRNTKTVFLSATPFNTPSSLDYAEGYIFSYPSGKDGETRQKRRNDFLRKNFGKSHRRNSQGDMTRMSEGQITDPEAVEDEEINFSNHLQDKLHTMSGRMLDSAYDYSRSFPRFDMPEAKLVNSAMSEISSGVLSDFFKKTLLDYNYSTAFWEIIKTGFALPRIKEHIALGRKVVVFHRRKASNQDVNCPFATGINEAMKSQSESVKQAAREFSKKYKELLAWEANLDYTYPQDRILNEFVTDEERSDYEKHMEAWCKRRNAAISAGKRVPPEPKLKSKRVGIFNGDQSAGEKQAAVDNFNFGNQDVIVVQVQSGKEGISLHDTEGNHQRVMMSLALPQSPIEFIQAEGRIYRVGNRSDAIFEYPLLGIDRELYDFAMKINGRSQTSENLAMGAQSRGLRDSITRGALGSTQIPVAEGQGKGGKMLDSRQTQNATGFDHAMGNWKEWQEKEAGLPYDERSIPDPLGVKLMEWAGAERGETVLVGYAGEGSAARYAPSSTKLIALESNSGKLARLAALLGGGGRKILGDDFMNDSHDPSASYSIVNKADIVIVKTKSGTTYKDGFSTMNRAVRDIRKALQHTEDSGRVVAIVPTPDLKGMGGIYKMLEEQRRFEGCVARTVINLPANIFGEAASVIIIDKNHEPSIAEAKAAKRIQIKNVEAGETAEESLLLLREEDVEKREVDRTAKTVKRVKRVLGAFQNSKLVSTERWRGRSEKSVSVSRSRVHIRFTKHLMPESANKLSRTWNGITIEFQQLGDRRYLEDIAKNWAGCKKLCEMSLEDFKETYSGKFRTDAQYQEAMDFMGHLCTLIEAATGKTPTQLGNIVEGKVENEIKSDMTLSEFQDIYKTLDSGSEELDALSERVFSVASQIKGLTFKMAEGRVFSGHNVMAHYAPGKNAIELNSDVFNSIRTSDAQKAQCILHETIHAVTCWALAQYKVASNEERKAMGPIAEACKDIEEVYKAINNDSFRAELQAKSKLKENAMYGLTDEYEMLAEMTNPAFRMALKAKRLWRQLVNGIKKLFGIDVLDTGEEGTTAFEVLNQAIETILNNFDLSAYALYRNNPHRKEHEMRNLFDESPSTENRSWVQRSLFNEDQAASDPTQSERTPDEIKAVKESEARTEEVNARIDEFTDRLSEIYGRYLNIEAEDEERQALIEERMNELIADELTRLRGHLEEYYLGEGNTTGDARNMARDMASRVLAEATLRLTPEESGEVWKQWNETNEASYTNTLITAGGEAVEFNTATSSGILTKEKSKVFRQLEPGEFCHVERKFTETKEFGFTGGEKIESLEDVAYIFRSLEDYSIENVFAVLVKDGRPVIVHLGMGGPGSSLADISALRGAMDAYGADEVYFVHNHPSGNLIPSPQDYELAKGMEQAVGSEKFMDCIIIDVTSGRYSTFSNETMFGRGERQWDDSKDRSDRKYPVLRMNRAVRSEDGKDIGHQTVIKSSGDVARFVSSKRLGSGNKVNYLLLSQRNAIIGNLHTSYNDYAEDPKGLADEIASMGVHYGAAAVITYGNVSMDDEPFNKLQKLVYALSGKSVRMLDAVQIDSRIDQCHISAQDRGMLAMEPEEAKAQAPLPFKGGEEGEGGVRFRLGDEDEESEIEQVNRRFNEELERQIDGTLPKGHVYEMGMPSEYLLSTGIANLPIRLSAKVLETKSNLDRHQYPLSALENLVNAIQTPWAIFEYGDKSKMQNIIVGIEDNGRQFLVGLAINPTVKGRVLEINSIRNVFPKNNHEWLNWIQEGKLLRVDGKKEIQAIIDKLRMNPVAFDYIDLDNVAKIIKNFENPALSWEFNTRYRVRDNNEADALNSTADLIEDMFNAAIIGELKGKPIPVGNLTEEGRKYLESLSGMKMKPNVKFVLNPSDLAHIFKNHFGENEKDPGNNIPLTIEDVRSIGDIISNPDKVVFGVENKGDKRKMFFFLKEDQTNGSLNLVEVYANAWGNLTAKSLYHTKKSVSQRVLSLKKSEHLTSVTDGPTLNFGAKLPKFFDTSSYSEEFNTRYRIREEEPPRKTGIGYKVFVLKDGKLYPPMVANPNGEATPIHVWLDADAAPIAGESKTGRLQVKAGGKGTQGGSGKLAYRPGWHLGVIPYALQFNRKGESGEKELFPANFVWAEVEYADDVDYQAEAMSYGYNKNGKFQHSYAGLPRLPENGSYKYRTNPNPETDPWIITGAMKVNRLLMPSEVDAMVRSAGREPQKRQAGAVTDEQIRDLNAQFERMEREGTGAVTDAEVSLKNDPWSKAWGESIRSKKKQTEYAQRERKRMRRRAEELSKTLGIDIEIAEDGSKFKGKKQRAKGWYDTKTGKITVIVGNHKSAWDMEATILHEAVAHHGLRELLGEHFDEFLDKVYEAAENGIKERIDLLATKNGWNRRVATEEYLAGLAEDTEFDGAEYKAGGWFDKIKRLFVDMLFKAGFKHLPHGSISDNELRYVLWRSYQNLANPGRYRAFEWEAEDVAMQFKLEVGEFSPESKESERVAERRELFRDGDFTPRDRKLVADAYDKMLAKGSYQFREAVQDSMLGLKKLYEAILGKGTPIEEVETYENAYVSENLMSSKSNAEQQVYLTRYFKPLLASIYKICGNDKAERRIMTDYMMAKHGLERNEYMRNQAAADNEETERDFAGLCGLTGEDDWQAAEAAAQQMVDDYEANHDTTDLWAKTKQATTATLEKIYLSGLISDDTFNKVVGMYDYYIPLRGWDETTSDEVYGYITGDNGPLMGNVFKEAEGRNSKADDPIATIAKMAIVVP